MSDRVASEAHIFTILLSQPYSHQSDEAIGELFVAFELNGMGDNRQLVVEVDNRALGEILARNFFEYSLSRRHGVDVALVVKPLVNILVAILAIVLRRL